MCHFIALLNLRKYFESDFQVFAICVCNFIALLNLRKYFESDFQNFAIRVCHCMRAATVGGRACHSKLSVRTEKQVAKVLLGKKNAENHSKIHSEKKCQLAEKSLKSRILNLIYQSNLKFEFRKKKMSVG